MSQTPKLEADVQAALDNGKKVTAIKLLRGHRGLGLKEAKMLVDGVSVDPKTSVSREASSRKGLINGVVLAVVVFVIYKLFFES